MHPTSKVCVVWWQGRRFRGCNRTSNIGHFVMCCDVASLMFSWCLMGCMTILTCCRGHLSIIVINGGGAASCGSTSTTVNHMFYTYYFAHDGWGWCMIQVFVDSSTSETYRFVTFLIHFVSTNAIGLSQLTSLFCELMFHRVERGDI